MKIQEILKEFEIPDSLRNFELANIGGASLTAGHVADVIPGMDPATVVKYGKEINSVLQKKITPTYTVADAALDAATIIPAVKGVAMARTALGAGRAVVGGALKREVGKELLDKAVTINPELTGKGGSTSSPASEPKVQPKKIRKNVGDRIPVTVGGKSVKLPITNVLPDGYEVDASSVPNAPSKKMTVGEPLSETASAGATSAGNIASLGMSPRTAVGSPAVVKRWGGSPGKMGTLPKAKPAVKQGAKDNAITNPKIGNNLIS